jgi:hypothetical protein
MPPTVSNYNKVYSRRYRTMFPLGSCPKRQSAHDIKYICLHDCSRQRIPTKIALINSLNPFSRNVICVSLTNTISGKQELKKTSAYSSQKRIYCKYSQDASSFHVDGISRRTKIGTESTISLHKHIPDT